MTAGMPSDARRWIDGAWLRLVAACGLLLAPLARADPLLDAARWQHRLLVIAAPSIDDATLRRQRALLADLGNDAAERKLVVIEVAGSIARMVPDDALPRFAPEALRRALSLAGDRFEVVLVGLDGGVKLRADQPLQACALLGVVDAMPMRRGASGNGGSPPRCVD